MAMPIGRDELASLVRSAMMEAMNMYVGKIEDGMDEKMRKMMGEYDRKMEGYSMKAADGVKSELETLKQERATLAQELKDVNRRVQDLEGDQPRANGYRASIAEDTVTDKAAPQPPEGENVIGELTKAMWGMNGGSR
jgi:predicted  nucleic acid-binding Zn-ribbon protein